MSGPRNRYQVSQVTELFDASDIRSVLWWTVSQGFTRHLIGPHHSPHLVVLSHDWGPYVDVAHIRSIERAEVARIPKRARELNLYCPDVVVWHYWGGIADALRALMLLPKPADGDGPTRPYQPPRSQPPEYRQLTVASDELRQVTVELPTNER